MRVQAKHLLKGDKLNFGETVVGVSAGVRTPAGKVEVTIERNGHRRTCTWWGRTEISVTRGCPRCGSPDPARHPAVQHGGEVQICSDPFHLVAATIGDKS